MKSKEKNTTDINISNKKKSGEQYLTLDVLRKMVGVDDKYTGKNITIAVIDSGVYTHDDLVKPQNRIVEFKDFVNNAEVPYDDYGHGTAICGIIAGNGYMSGGVYKGIAPESNIVAIKVIDKKGNASVENLAKAIKWVCDNKEKYNIRILNISMGVHYCNSDASLLKPYIDEAIKLDILVIASVGNKHFKQDNKYLPADFNNVLAVGSIENKSIKNISDYRIAYFSSAWVTKDGENKPDLVAPGNMILSIQSDVLFNPLYSNNMSMIVSYSPTTGTSNSAAVVSGVSALLMQKYSHKPSSYIKEVILKDCVKINDDLRLQGQGFLYLK